MAQSRRKRVYLAGPMRGMPYMNFPAFFAAADKLRALHYEVFNPAENDNIRHGTDVSAGNPTGDQAQLEREHGFNLREALASDLAFICNDADAIALLPGWDKSKGATAEHRTAIALGLEVIFLDENFDPQKKIIWHRPTHFELHDESDKAKTYDEGKEPLAHLPWAAIDELAMVQAYGHKKYGDFYNYKKGMEVSRNLSCALRHIRDYMSGKDATMRAA